MASFTAEQKIARARMALMNHPTWSLYAGILMIGSLKVVEEGVTAATNGRDVIFGHAFVDSLADPELRFVLLHENEHKALRQITTYDFLCKIDKPLTNQAMDHVVNLRLTAGDAGEGFITLPKGVLCDPKFSGMSTKQVFDILRAQKQQQDPEQGGKGKKGQKGDPQSGEGFDEHDFEGGQEMSAEEQEELKKDIDRAIRQGGLLAGQLGSKNKNMLDDVLTSQIRWQEILAEFIKSVTKGRDNSSWSKINRRWVSQGIYLPSSISETVGGLLIAGDASGSTWSGNQLAGFLGEAKAIIEDVMPEFVDFMWWDTSVQKVWHFLPEDYPTMMDQIKQIEGGGGTSPSCITNWIRAQAQEPASKREYVAAIVLSDGQVGNDWGGWRGCGVDGGDLPVLWCINTKGITSPVGQTLYIEDCQ